MLRTRSARTRGRNPRTHAGLGHHGLAGTDGSTVNRLTRYRRGRSLRNAGTRLGGSCRHGRPRRAQLSCQVRPRGHHGTSGGLSCQWALLLGRRRTGCSGHWSWRLLRLRAKRRRRPRRWRRRGRARRRTGGKWLARAAQDLSGSRRSGQGTRGGRGRSARSEHRCGRSRRRLLRRRGRLLRRRRCRGSGCSRCLLNGRRRGRRAGALRSGAADRRVDRPSRSDRRSNRRRCARRFLGGGFDVGRRSSGFRGGRGRCGRHCHRRRSVLPGCFARLLLVVPGVSRLALFFVTGGLGSVEAVQPPQLQRHVFID